jgi:hypothetical protein
VLTAVGPLGINPTDDVTRVNTAFDILTTGTPAAPVNTGFASLTTTGISSGFYTIDLNTGAATLVGAIGTADLVRGIAVVPQITQPATLYAIDVATNNLVRFNAANPSTIISSIPVTGLVGGDTILGIDFRPATGELFGLGSGSRLYVINPVTGAAVQRGSDGQFTLSGQSFGFDFNPFADRIRVVSDFEQNLRLNPNDGTLAGTDMSIGYDPTDPGFPTNPQLAGSAYTNNFNGTATTTLFGIDTTRDVLVRQGGVNVPPGTPSPNGGHLFSVGSLGFAIPDANGLPNGFDILTQADGTNVAIAGLTLNGTTTNLYSIDLATGAATQVGAVPIGGAAPLLIRGLTVAPAGDFEFSAPSYAVGESGPVATITVNRNGGSEGIATVAVSTADGTAVAPGDYTDSDQVLTFFPGQTSQTFTIPLNNDTDTEADETINLALSNPGGGARLGAQSTAVLTIIDNDPPSISINDVTLAEGNAGTTAFTFNVTLSHPSPKPITFEFSTQDGSATLADADYQAIQNIMTFAPGETSKPVTILVNGDLKLEPTETFIVHIGTPTGDAPIARGMGIGTIINDDTPTIAVSDVVLSEGNAGQTAFTFTLTRSGSDLNVSSTVDFFTSGGTALAISDYHSTSGVVEFLPNQTTRTVTVFVNGDTSVEPDEMFFLNLVAPFNANVPNSVGTGTIVNDDVVARTLSVNNVSTTEGNSGTKSLTFTVKLSSAAPSNVTVQFSTAQDSATNNVDYVQKTGTLTFTPGQISKTVTVAVKGDTAVELNERFKLNLFSATGPAAIGDSTGFGTIVNDDGGGLPAINPSIRVNDVSVTEGNSGTKVLTFTVSLSAKTSKTVSVKFTTADGTAKTGDGDYVGKSGTLTFAAGQLTKTVSIVINGDTKNEANESFSLLLSAPVNSTIADPIGIGTIDNND